MPREDGTVTADECRDAVRSAGITRTKHHRCGGCGYMTGYVFEPASDVFIDPSKEGMEPSDLVVGYDPGCDCSSCGPAGYRFSSWEDFADSFNMQDTPERRLEMFERFKAGKATHDTDE